MHVPRSLPRSLVVLVIALSTGCSESSSKAGATGAGPGSDKAGSPEKKQRAGKPNGGKPGGGGPFGGPALVSLAVVGEGALTDGLTFLGRAESVLSAELATAVGGHVISVKAREGDKVEARQPLVVLDSAKIRAELAASKAREQGIDAELAHARKQFERIAKLSYPTVSEPERERFELDIAKLEAQLAVQRAETRRLQVELERHSLKAPFAGIVSARHVDPGAWVNPGTPVLGLVSLSELEIHVDVSADLGGRLHIGDAVKVRGSGEVGARIVGIVGVLDPSTRTMRVRLAVEDRPAWLLAGMAVDVEFAVTMDGAQLGAQGVLVPRDALLRGPVRTRVIKYVDGQDDSAAEAGPPGEGGTAQPIYVRVLATAGERALVVPEPDEPTLAVGDRVVIRGNERLRPGQRLQIVERQGG